MAPDSLLEGIDEGDGGVLPVQGEPDGVFNAPGDLGQKRRLANPLAGVHIDELRRAAEDSLRKCRRSISSAAAPGAVSLALGMLNMPAPLRGEIRVAHV